MHVTAEEVHDNVDDFFFPLPSAVESDRSVRVVLAIA